MSAMHSRGYYIPPSRGGTLYVLAISLGCLVPCVVVAYLHAPKSPVELAILTAAFVAVTGSGFWLGWVGGRRSVPAQLRRWVTHEPAPANAPVHTPRRWRRLVPVLAPLAGILLSRAVFSVRWAPMLAAFAGAWLGAVMLATAVYWLTRRGIWAQFANGYLEGEDDDLHDDLYDDEDDRDTDDESDQESEDELTSESDA